MEEYVMPEKKKKKGNTIGMAILVAVLFVGLIVLANSIVITAENEYTLIKQFGKTY